jgi:secondary thiamine-phosphate synthase enzyme
MALLSEFTLDTNSNGYYNITAKVKSAVAKSGVKEGIAVVYCPHTTAGITINENADPDVVRDMSYTFDKLIPKLPEYRHFEGNSDAHVKSTLTGAEKTLIITNGHILLGTWQGIYFAEYDAPRSRTYYVKVIEG